LSAAARVTGRSRANGDVLAVGFVPNGNDLDALIGCQDKRLKLCLGLMRETVANAREYFPSAWKLIAVFIFNLSGLRWMTSSDT